MMLATIIHLSDFWWMETGLNDKQGHNERVVEIGLEGVQKAHKKSIVKTAIP